VLRLWLSPVWTASSTSPKLSSRAMESSNGSGRPMHKLLAGQSPSTKLWTAMILSSFHCRHLIRAATALPCS
jgi:hypothetical protein